MAMLVGLLIWVKDPGDVRNRRVAKSRNVLINHVGRTYFPYYDSKKTKFPPHWIYYTSIAHISVKTWISVLMNAYLWFINDGNASWSVYVGQRPRPGTKPANGNIANCSYFNKVGRTLLLGLDPIMCRHNTSGKMLILNVINSPATPFSTVCNRCKADLYLALNPKTWM